jgi:acyl-CoA thioesterase I
MVLKTRCARGDFMQYAAIQVWGDSVLKGVVYDPVRSRYTLLKDSAISMLSRTFQVPFENLSKMGRTAPEALEAMKSMDADAFRDKLVVIEYGGNDCDFNWAEVARTPDAPHAPHTPVEQFADALREMASHVRAMGGTPLMCSLPPLDPRRYLKWIVKDGLDENRILSFLGVPERIYRWQEYYSTMVMKVASEVNCRWLPLREAFLSAVRGEDVLCEDGIPPNDRGHQLIYDAAVAFEKQFPINE